MSAEVEHEPDGRRRRGLRRRALLAEAVREVVARDGVAGVSHGSVASAAGLPRSAVSHHFGSLDELLTAALRGDTEALVAALDDVPASPDRTALRWFAGRLVEILTENRERIAAGYELYLLASRRPALREAIQAWLDLLGRLAGAHSTDAARVRAAVALVDGWFLQHLATGTTPDADELAALLDATLGS